MMQFRIQRIGAEEQTEALREQCEMLWSSNFDDSLTYRNFYFNRKWKKSETWMLSEPDGNYCSMLHLNPYIVSCNGIPQKLHYIVGVCTEKKQRKKGYMRELLTASMAQMYQREEPFTYLMPAAAAIYEPYDFRFFSQAERVRTVCEVRKKFCLEYRFERYQEIDQNKKDALIEMSNRLLKQNQSIYVIRTMDYLEELSEEMKACGGDVLVCWKQNQIIGYVAYGSEDGVWEIFEALGKQMDEQWLDSIWNYLEENDAQRTKEVITEREKAGKEKEKKRVLVDDMTFLSHRELHGKTTPLLMARIIHFPSFAALMRSREKREYVFALEDRWLPQNAGIWKLTMDHRQCLVEKMPPDTKTDHQITIAELVELWMKNQNVYLNELG